MLLLLSSWDYRHEPLSLVHAHTSCSNPSSGRNPVASRIILKHPQEEADHGDWLEDPQFTTDKFQILMVTFCVLSLSWTN
jgi:hypothetical protein